LNLLEIRYQQVLEERGQALPADAKSRMKMREKKCTSQEIAAFQDEFSMLAEQARVDLEGIRSACYSMESFAKSTHPDDDT
jgi:cell division protein FtsB